MNFLRMICPRAGLSGEINKKVLGNRGIVFRFLNFSIEKSGMERCQPFFYIILNSYKNNSKFSQKYLHLCRRYAIILFKEKGVAAIDLEIEIVFSGRGT